MVFLTPLDIGEKLKQLRLEQKFDQADMGAYIDVSDRTVRNIEKGALGTKALTVFLAANELGLSLYLLLNHQDRMIKVQSMTTIGEQVRKARKTQKIRQDDLAAIVGIQHSVLGRIERGNGAVAIGTLFNLLAELGIQVLDQEGAFPRSSK